MRLASLGLAWVALTAFTAPLSPTAIIPGTESDTPALSDGCTTAPCLNSAQTYPQTGTTVSARAPLNGVALTVTHDSVNKLESGDRLLKVNRTPVNTLSDVASIVEDSARRTPRPVDVLLSRRGELVFLTVSLQEMRELLDDGVQPPTEHFGGISAGTSQTQEPQWSRAE